MNEIVNQKSNLYYGIQVLRALCCICIVVAHSCAYAEWEYGIFGLDFFGRYGMLNLVALFFMMSAYLTVEKLDRGKTSFWGFVKSRFWGIYPIYWLCVATVVVVSLCVNHIFQVSGGFWKSLFLMGGDVTYVCSVEWTLWYEIAFYFIIALFFLFTWGKKVFPFAFIVFFIYFIIRYDGTNVINNMLKIPFSIPFIAFIVGIIAYYLEKIIKKCAGEKIRFIFESKPISHLSYVVVCCVLFFLSLYVLDYRYFSSNSLWKVLILYFVLLLCFLCFKYINVNRNTILIYIGNASYGIYLLHPTLIKSTFCVLNRIGVNYSLVLHFFVVVINLFICFIAGSFYKELANFMREYINNLKFIKSN